jgi:hypothetical protein
VTCRRDLEDCRRRRETVSIPAASAPDDHEGDHDLVRGRNRWRFAATNGIVVQAGASDKVASRP